ITASLETRPRSLPAFQFLIQLYSLAKDAPLLDEEWTALYSILIQVQKIRNYARWLVEETNVTLGPDLFQVPDRVPIPGLYSTGVNGDGTLLGDGKADPHWTSIA